MKPLSFGIILVVITLLGCDKTTDKNFPYSKIEELKSKPVYNPPASVWKWDYKGATYYYVTANCCDQYNELYDSKGNLVCHPDGGFMGRGDGKCPFSVFSSDTLNLKRILVWLDNRK